MALSKWIVAAALLGATAVQAATGVAVLGSEKQVKDMFSYPNNCNSICSIDQTLDQTVSHYLQQSLKRDGYAGSTFKISRYKGFYRVKFKGEAAKTYPARLEGFMRAGHSAFLGAQKLNRDKKWQYNWRFFLPLGLAMVNNPTIELLHFPPDYSLEEVQDYLKAKTTARWGELLERNGVAPNLTDRYQTIVDIAPIAAPADAGQALEGVYGYFDDYVDQMLSLWGQPATVGPARPMVAFGGPVRDWIAQKFGDKLAVLDVATLSFPKLGNVPVIAANHPSYIYYAANSVKSGPDKDQKNFAIGMKVMQQDLIAACWQASMSTAPLSGPKTVESTCAANWKPKKLETCELLETQVYNKTPQEAEAFCKALPWAEADMPTDAAAAALERSAPLNALAR